MFTKRRQSDDSLYLSMIWKFETFLQYTNPGFLFLVPNPLNNQSDILKYLWRYDFVQDELDSSRFLKMVDKTLDRCILCYTR